MISNQLGYTNNMINKLCLNDNFPVRLSDDDMDTIATIARYDSIEGLEADQIEAVINSDNQ